MEEPISKPTSRKLFEEAVDDSQYLMAYASSKCPKDINRDTIEKLINARHRVDNKQAISAKEEADFWLAYQDIWKLVSPVTAECIKATESPAARRTIKGYISFTVSVLILLLIFQIYWVIGNQSTKQLDNLLQQETELSNEIRVNQDEYSAIELRFRQSEWDDRNIQDAVAESIPVDYYYYYNYEYPYSPEFQRDTAENLFTRTRLEADLVSLKSQLERNNTIIRTWSKPWQWLIQSTLSQQGLELDAQIKSNTNRITEINNQLKRDQNGQTKIQETKSKIHELENELVELNKTPTDNQSQILEINSTLDGLRNDVINFEQLLPQELKYLEDQITYLNLQKTSQSIQENSRQAYLAAQFVLIILQSYLLPLLYGILGAATSVLRSLSREIDEVIFSDKRGIQHLLRISLGVLAGIMVGWFSFLISNESFLGSVSPLAIAFLVGYNIDIFFSRMDTALDRLKEGRQQTTSTTKEEQGTALQKASPSSAKREKPSRGTHAVKGASKQTLPTSQENNQTAAPQTDPPAPPSQEKPSVGTPALEGGPS